MENLIKFIIIMLLVTTYVCTIERNLRITKRKSSDEVYDILVMVSTISAYIYLLYTL